MAGQSQTGGRDRPCEGWADRVYAPSHLPQSGLLSGCLFLLHLCVIPLGRTPEVILFVVDFILFGWLR